MVEELVFLSSVPCCKACHHKHTKYMKYYKHSYYLIFSETVHMTSLNQEATITINPGNGIQRVEGSLRQERTRLVTINIRN